MPPPTMTIRLRFSHGARTRRRGPEHGPADLDEHVDEVVVGVERRGARVPQSLARAASARASTSRS